VAHIDVYPTLLAVAGGRPRAGTTLDGVSFLPVLRKPRATLAREAIYWHFPGYLESYVHDRGWRTAPVGAIHAGDWKLLEYFETGTVELYNVRVDPGETRNLAAESAARVQELQSKLVAWRQSVGAAMPRHKTPAELAADATAPSPPPKAGKKGGKRQAK